MPTKLTRPSGGLNARAGLAEAMSDPEDEHAYSEGRGFDDPYEAFDIDPPELSVGPDAVDPVDSHVLADILDERQIPADQVDVQALIDVGLEYVGINRHEEAITTFERAVAFAEEDGLEAQEALVNKGVAHAELEEWDDAIGAYRSAIEIDDRSEHAGVAETNLAYALWESGQHDRALEHAERAVELDERLPQAWYNRGFFLLERGLAEDALFCFENAEKLGLRTAELLEEQANALDELGEYAEAEEVREEAERQQAEREEALLR